MKLACLVPAVLALSSCNSPPSSNEAVTNEAALAVELLNAADGDMAIVRASGGDLEKARLLAAGKRMAAAPEAQKPEASPTPVAKPKPAGCWTPPSGPNVIDDPDRPIRFDEIEEIEKATGRPFQQGDTIHGRAEDRCPA